MTDYVDYSSSGQAQSMARHSEHSTQSWVHQRTSSVPPPQPLNLPTPVQPLRPLPNPHRASVAQTLRVVNTPAPPTAEVDLLLRRNVVESESGTVTSGSPQQHDLWSDSSMGNRLRPRKKKSFVGGFVKGIRKLPRTVFGYGAGIGAAGKKKHGTDPSATDGTSASTTDSTTNTLPPYRSNPSSPAVALGPGRSGLNKQFMPNMVITEPTIPESPPPNVVRLDSRRNSGNPSLRVFPPSGNYDDNTNFYTENQTGEFSHHDHYDNPADRTTVMLYNETNSRYDPNRSTHPPIAQQRSPSPGLSYVSSEPLATLRPASYHSSHTAIRIPPPVDGGSDEATPRPIYASPTPRRVSSHSVLAGAPPITSSAPQSQIQTPPPNQLPQSTDPSGPPPADVTSPMSIHPEPTNDYRKMSDLSSPSPTSRDTLTTATSFYDPSFTSLNPVERFFKKLYHMPWVSHNRVTVDYLPGEGAHKQRRRRSKPMSSWYHSILNNSRRSSATLDLLSNGTGSAASPGSSLRASIAMALGSPLSRSRQHGHTSDKPKERRHRSHHHHSSSRHHQGRRHAHDSRKRDRYTATSMATSNTNTNMQQAPTKHSSSPLIPSVYPFQYPPYPYPAFSAFPVPAPAPVPVNALPSQPGDRPSASPRGPRKGHEQHKQPVVYASPGYAPYQPMVGVPQVFLISPTSPRQASSGVPAALVPGGVHDGHGHVAQPAGQQEQRQPTPARQVGAQNIPGAF